MPTGGGHAGFIAHEELGRHEATAGEIFDGAAGQRLVTAERLRITRNVANGYAGVGADGKIAVSELSIAVLDKDLETAPGSPTNGDRHIIAGIGGAWSAFTVGDIVGYQDGWVARTPIEGDRVWVSDEDRMYYFKGSSWSTYDPTETLPAEVIPGLGVDSTQVVQDALDNFSSTIVPYSLRIDGTIIIPRNKALTIRAEAQLTRTVDDANIDPVVWVKNNECTLRGEAKSSVVRSYNVAPKGVVRIGHADLATAGADCVYADVHTLSIYGKEQFGAVTGDPDICLYMPNSNMGGQSYFHHVDNVLCGSANIGVKIHGNTNSISMTRMEFIRLGGNDVGVENAAIYFDGGRENRIFDFFFHFSPNARCVYICQDSGVAVSQNQIKGWTAEPDTSAMGTAQGVVVKAIGIGNEIQGQLNGITNDLIGATVGLSGATASDWYGPNRRNTWIGVNEHLYGTPLTVRRPSASLTLDSTDVAGGRLFSIFAGGTYHIFRDGASTNLWRMYPSGNFYPEADGAANIGGPSNQLNAVYLDDGVYHGGTKVLGARQVAAALANSANSGDPDTDALIEALRALVIAHGLGAPS